MRGRPGIAPAPPLAEFGALEFLPLDEAKFPSVALARTALASGESAPAVFNGANEVAVRAFLDERLPFPAIVDTIRAVLERHDPRPVGSLEEALGWDAWARREAERRLAARPLSR